MGASFQGKCFQTVALATDAYYSAVPVQATPGNTSFLLYYKWSGTAWRMHGDSVNVFGTINSRWDVVAPAVAFPVCDEYEALFDGMTLGWGVVLAMAVAWGFREMKRQAK